MPKAFRLSDTDPSVVDAVSDHAICNQGVMPLRHPSANPVRAPLENHLQSLNGFLNVHIENLHALQNSLRPTADKKPVTPSKLSTAATVYPALTFIIVTQKRPPASSDINEKFFNALTQQFSMLVAIVRAIYRSMLEH